MVCIQSSDVTTPEEPWYITNPNPDMDSLKQRFPLNETLFEGVLPIQYDNWGYNRLMLIGRV